MALECNMTDSLCPTFINYIKSELAIIWSWNMYCTKNMIFISLRGDISFVFKAMCVLNLFSMNYNLRVQSMCLCYINQVWEKWLNVFETFCKLLLSYMELIFSGLVCVCYRKHLASKLELFYCFSVIENQ